MTAVFVIHPITLYAHSLASALRHSSVDVKGFSESLPGEQTDADVFLVDLDSPSVPLPHLLKQLRMRRKSKIVGMTVDSNPPRTIGRRVDSFVQKTSMLDAVLEELGCKESQLQKLQSKILKSELPDSLSKRELEVAQHIKAMKSGRSIAQELGVERRTIRTYLQRIEAKIEQQNEN